MSQSPSYSPFPNGTSAVCWRSNNCDRCRKGPPPDLDGQNLACDLEDTLALAHLLDGTLMLCGEKTAQEAAEMARRLGWSGAGYLMNDCPEIDRFSP